MFYLHLRTENGVLYKNTLSKREVHCNYEPKYELFNKI